MSTALTVPEMPVMDLGKVLAESGYFQDARQAAQAVVKVLAGRELGFGPIASMRNIKISKNGSIILAAELQASAVRKSGIYDYEVDKLDDTECLILFYCKSARTGAWKKLGESRFTQADMERAEAGKLIAPGASKSMAARFPRNMLFARAISNGVKWYCPDVTNGISVYTAEELGEVVDGETGEVIAQEDPGPKWPTESAMLEPQEPSGNGNGAATTEPTAAEAAPEPPKKSEAVKSAALRYQPFVAWANTWVQNSGKDYARKDNPALADMWHLLKRVGMLGYREVTAENADDIKATLESFVRGKVDAAQAEAA